MYASIQLIRFCYIVLLLLLMLQTAVLSLVVCLKVTSNVLRVNLVEN